MAKSFQKTHGLPLLSLLSVLLLQQTALIDALIDALPLSNICFAAKLICFPLESCRLKSICITWDVLSQVPTVGYISRLRSRRVGKHILEQLWI